MANEGMKISQAGRDLIAQFEGLRLSAYRDSVGVWTIGYGHTQGVYGGQTITLEQANRLLDQDIASHVTGIIKFVTVQLNQNQFDALASFHFNLGPYILQGSTLLRLINAKKWQEAANEMKKYVHAGGQVLQGLVNRRNAEASLFLKPVSNDTNQEKTKKRGEIMLLFRPINDPTVYWLVGNKFVGMKSERDLNLIRLMMTQAGYDIHVHTNLDQIAYIRKLAEEVK